MKAVMVEVPAQLLEERRRAGADRRDEVWEGVLHMVPRPSGAHQRFAGQLFHVLDARAGEKGLVGSYETGLFRPGTNDDYRVPDQVYARPEQLSARGVDGRAELVVEIRSPGARATTSSPSTPPSACPTCWSPIPRGDEPSCSCCGATATCCQSDARGETSVESLGVRLSTVDVPRLRLTWPGGHAEL